MIAAELSNFAGVAIFAIACFTILMIIKIAPTSRRPWSIECSCGSILTVSGSHMDNETSRDVLAIWQKNHDQC